MAVPVSRVMVQRQEHEQLNVLADHRAAAALETSMRLPNHTVLPLPACQDYICDSTGYLTSREPHAQNQIHPVRASSGIKNATTDQTGSTTPSADLLTDQPLLDTLTVSRTFVIKLSHAASYPSVYANDDAALNAPEIETVPPVYNRYRARAPWRHRFRCTSADTLQRPTLQPTYAA
jgi:hypothetical protein